MNSEFSEWLRDAKFFILLELPLPREKADIPVFYGTLKKIQTVILSPQNNLKCGIAFTTHSDEINSDFSEFLSDIPIQLKNKSLFYLSGRNNNIKNLHQQLESLKRLEIKNIVPVTGERKQNREKNVEKSQYLDSVNAIEIVNKLYRSDFFCGAVVNPFKYTPEESYSQYYKLMKKIKVGAQFAGVQAGWDMRKIQELRWFLENRDCHIPTIARNIVLTPEIFEEILSGVFPGIVISDDIRQILNQESKYGYAQFASAQWRRLQLFSSGARFLGYSGIQIAGLERPEHTETAIAKIIEAMNEFKNFDEWKEEYHNYLSRVEPAPFPYNFYIFENLLKSQYPDGNLKFKDIKNCNLSITQKIKYNICRIILSKSHRQVPEEHFLTKKILLGCKSCKYCRVSLTYYVCPERCPKGLANGPCGGSFAGGLCEFRTQSCIYKEIFRHALWKKEISGLEERIIKAPE
ncbi:MAG TPA: methylenetetrahydrofolate reductase C-terminal domain-containing protein [Victivallales bacterium]|nr:methylenetetrahydrofolate reductase C-terminal domain-containing protein [Victivallales bacterium]HRR29348.1 methylenetetrahydrofolate reductase C-terminal domain-containing protein [Victivallales bacterium]HRU01658.1 methylenetetrahydrofolate reductase C-terminal domain-containing protein [Victivallales bacterium]